MPEQFWVLECKILRYLIYLFYFFIAAIINFSRSIYRGQVEHTIFYFFIAAIINFSRSIYRGQVEHAIFISFFIVIYALFAYFTFINTYITIKTGKTIHLILFLTIFSFCTILLGSDFFYYYPESNYIPPNSIFIFVIALFFYFPLHYFRAWREVNKDRQTLFEALKVKPWD